MAPKFTTISKLQKNARGAQVPPLAPSRIAFVAPTTTHQTHVPPSAPSGIASAPPMTTQQTQLPSSAPSRIAPTPPCPPRETFTNTPRVLESLPRNIEQVRKQSTASIERGLQRDEDNSNNRSSFLPPPEGKRYKVEWDKYGCSIGIGGHELNKALSAISKNGELWPLDKKWTKMKEMAFYDSWDLLVAQFDLNGHDNACSYCFKIIHSRWRDWKSYVKKHCYEPYESDVERLENCDPRVIIDQLKNSMDEWNKPESQRLSEINKVNRGKRKMNHHTGSISFAQLRQRMQKEKGKSPTKLELLKEAYAPKDDGPNKELIMQMNDFVLTQQSQESNQSQEEIEELAISSVLGPQKSDRVRGGGVGALTKTSRKQAFLHGATSANVMQERIHTLESSNARLEASNARLEKMVQSSNDQMMTFMQFIADRMGVELPNNMNPQEVNPRSSSSSAPGFNI